MEETSQAYSGSLVYSSCAISFNCSLVRDCSVKYLSANSIPFFIAILFFINWRVICDGANDNLTANYAAMGVIKEMAENDKRYENTEVCCMLAGAEEAGIRGSVNYAKRHQDELNEVETIVIAMDTMREIEQLQIYTQGCTGTQKNSNAVGELIYEAERLIHLVNDIIKLSKLDEGEISAQKEEVNLFALSREICDRLQQTARKNDVGLTLSGENCVVSGIGQRPLPGVPAKLL